MIIGKGTQTKVHAFVDWINITQINWRHANSLEISFILVPPHVKKCPKNPDEGERATLHSITK